ncbi:non-ribosomal peptide synthetase, partial [Rhodococcoides yunnanense]|uniref:non-ribosomal peptide synthetase n=1 Tax=Rhodococcoides yunnanense TaxID=278209 RepID=UPI000B27E3B5
MSNGRPNTRSQSAAGSVAVDELPSVIAAVVAAAPDRIALTHGETAVSYTTLSTELAALEAAMGGALGTEALVTVVLSNLLPGALESGGLAAIVDSIAADASELLGDVAPAGSPTLVSRFEDQVARTPDATAIEFEGTALTYAEFDARANRLARHLVGRGVGPESLVGLGIRRSLDLLVGMYAIVKTGAAYVPLDPDHPADRLAYVLDVAQPAAVLALSTEPLDLPAGTGVVEIDTLDLDDVDATALSDEDRVRSLTDDAVAYVIFTSGSTGRPKGVAVSHRAIVSNVQWRQDEYALTTDDVVLQKTPFTFDVSVWEFFWPLQVGARLVIAAHDGHRDPAYLARVMTEREVTVAHFVPSMLAVFVAEPSVRDITTLRYVFASGEALPAQTTTRFHTISSAELHNLYGPTEAAVDVTYYATEAAETGSVPIGRAVADTQLYVLDDALRTVPVGVEGELYLAGIQLARGYVARPDLTADRFVADPFDAGRQMYRTGDLVRWVQRGDVEMLEYVGRTDFQVKLRGLRIELGEIETAVLEHTSVSQAVALVHSDDTLGDVLVAYVVPALGATIEQQDLADAVGSRLPEYMIPGLFVAVDEFPLGSSGKLDRKALPAPDFSSLASEYREPSTDSERAIAEVFQEVLGSDTIGVDDDFFAIGGNSLIATRVISRINARFAIRVDVRDFFDAPTVAGLAVIVDDAIDVGAGGLAPLVPQERPEIVPLSLAQQRMWFLNRFDTASAVNNIPVAIRLTGELDVPALESAIRDVLARHESVRTMYPEIDGVGSQLVLDVDAVAPTLTAEPVSESDVLARVVEFVSVGFDVTAEVPFRARLFEVVGVGSEFVVVFVVHHIAADGFSMGPLTRDVMGAYVARAGGGEPGWAPLPVQYADFALWQRGVLGSESESGSLLSEQVAFWRSALAGLPEQLDLPSDRARPV